jgi:hypothetical protein
LSPSGRGCHQDREVLGIIPSVKVADLLKQHSHVIMLINRARPRPSQPAGTGAEGALSSTRPRGLKCFSKASRHLQRGALRRLNGITVCASLTVRQLGPRQPAAPQDECSGTERAPARHAPDADICVTGCLLSPHCKSTCLFQAGVGRGGSEMRMAFRT